MSPKHNNKQSIVYVFDSLRRDYVGCYDSDVNTPNIDQVAEDGVKFDQVQSQGIWTVPSSGSIFTGLYPEAHQSNQFSQPIDSGLPRITDGPNAAGAKTICFSTTNVVSKERGFSNGFDEFHQLGKDGAGLEPDIGERLNEKLLPRIRELSDTDFFILVWTLGTHHPYVTPDTSFTHEFIDGDQETMRRGELSDFSVVDEMYRENIEYCDSLFGELLSTLKSENIYNQTDIFVTSDHGEVFTEHARLEHSNSAIQKALKYLIPKETRIYYSLFDRSAFVGHQGIYPYQELISVPLVAKFAESETSKQGIDQSPRELIDIAATISQIYQGSSDDLQGHDLRDESSRQYLFSSSQITGGQCIYRSVTDGDRKLLSMDLDSIDFDDWTDPRTIQSIFSYAVAKTEILTSLDAQEKSIEETKNLERLQSVLNEHVERCREINDDFSNEDSEVDLADETMKQLEDLGYK
ncbi:hypothetical protein C5B86_03995 [Haloferax sp. Atlit-19N]|uniref:sulfatase-like hydrolase/transferase n=1 Tax=Haloferax sp. Atlit-19N TaxID=2077201 RepID=UPI000E22F17D|nr:sulfatase-like hydrolase/transferase [Haloferax sp. Atlit-19N]RDZ48218.1 hypothetical protein C5B86_03995 [Haloferax sp. Atlit-19N]